MILIDEWKPADGLILEPNAERAASETLRCLGLTAGPGAGKSEMLAQRADFLLRTGTCPYPKRILAISFKVDASKNLKERIYKRCGAARASRFDSYTFHAFAKRIVDRFRVLLTGTDALPPNYKIGNKRITGEQITFKELVPLAIQILKCSQIARNAIRQTYSDVFLDEFQDCTDLQYELVKIAFQGTSIRLTAVGDTKQKIMGWAGALDGIFLKFQVDFNAVPLNMYRNFRSKPRLLRLQNEIIRVLDPTSVMKDEQLVGEEGEVYCWKFNNCKEEAESVANQVEYWLKEKQIPLSEIAVLVSKQLDMYAHQLMAAFENKGIPYRNEQQMQDITVEPAARLIVDFLSCLYGQREPKAWIRLMNLLIPFTDDDAQTKSEQQYHRFMKEQKKSVAIAQAFGAAYTGWWDYVKAFLKAIGMETLTALSPDYETKSRLVDVVNETESHIEGLLKIEPDLLTALKCFSDDQAVRILTIHKSKGLEFDSVIIMAVENEIFFGDQNENRCAFFVGVSRAKQRLVLTHVDERQRPPNANGRWNIKRTAQQEYFNYVLPFVEPVQ
ncbi:MAG: superfamily I DNA/RNA helicase [Oleiphilaceae bacterium]